MRVAIANDLLMSVEALRRVILAAPGYELAWIARNGAEAVAHCAADTPDLILMDLVMPVMDGVEATRRIMADSPCAILLVTASVNGLAAKVFAAMGYGALDAVGTPSWHPDHPEGSPLLLTKMATIAKLIGKSPRQRSRQALSSLPVPLSVPCTLPPLVVIGASTGGPHALASILVQFPATLKATIVIVQHVDAQFSASFADWLNGQVPLPVTLATPNSCLEAGTIVIAGTNDHLALASDLRLHYTSDPQNCIYRPSVDVLFQSVAEYWPKRGIGLLLTGMGRDGAVGLAKLRAKGWHTIAQDRASSVVYGMPKAAAELNAATEVLPLSAIATACLRHLS